MACLEAGRHRRRVLMVCPRFLPRTGGVETHVHEVGRRLRAMEWDVEVLTVDDTNALPASEVIGELPVARVGCIRQAGEALLAPGLVRAMRRGDWDLVHIQHFHACVAPLALWAAWRKDIPTVVTFHGGGQRHWARSRLWPPSLSTLAPFALDAAGPLLRWADALIAVARFEIVDLARRIGVPEQRFTLVPNGCELPRTNCAARARDPAAPRIVSIGRLVAGKGHERVLEALPHVLAQRPDTRLWIAGDGPLEGRLRRQARMLGVEHTVDFSAVPLSRRTEFAARLSAMDVIVAMSDFEAHPIGVIEALRLGLTAVVADDRAGLGELAAGGLARVVARGAAPRELAATILAAVDEPLTIEPDTFPAWDDCARRIECVYESVLASPRRHASTALGKLGSDAGHAASGALLRQERWLPSRGDCGYWCPPAEFPKRH
jgi:glycogen synthase